MSNRVTFAWLPVVVVVAACTSFGVPSRERADGVTPPEVAAVVPAAAPAGALVAITGSFFGPTSDPARSRVLIGAQDAPVVAWSGRMIVVRIPAPRAPVASTAPAAATRTETRMVVVVDNLGSNPGDFERIDFDAAFAALDECADGACGFECRLDAASFEPCLSPVVVADLADGAHSFAVRITGPDGYVEPSGAVTSWTVDTVAPDTQILTGPVGTVGDTSGVFTFGCDEAQCTFECSIDGGAWQSCVDGGDLGPFAAGAHALKVRARDLAGNVDGTPAQRDWTTAAAPAVTVTDVYSLAATGMGLARAVTCVQPGANMGRVVAIGDDYNQNGSKDILAGGIEAVFVLDGQTLATIGQTVTGPIASSSFADAIAPLSDVDGDGIGDFAVGAPDAGTAGTVYVYSGAQRSLLYKVEATACFDENFGASIVQGEDRDGDGIGDLIVGAPGINEGLGAVYVIAAADGAELLRVRYDGAPSGSCVAAGGALRSSDKFGATVALLGDLDGDGVRDFAAQDHRNEFNPAPYPRVVLFSAAGGATVGTILSPGDAPEFGQGPQAMADAGDHNGDGVPDVWIGDRGVPSDGDYGAAHLIDGANQQTLLTITGDTDASGFALNEYFGRGIVPAADLDRDGRRDWFISDHDESVLQFGSSNFVFGVSADVGAGTSAKVGRIAAADGANTGFGAAVAAADIDGDGQLDVVIGEPQWGGNTGRIHVVRAGTYPLRAAGTNHPPTFRLGGDGAVGFEYSVDGGAWLPVANPDAFAATGLAAGTHTIAVRALDALANPGVPQNLAVDVDLTPPTVNITWPPMGWSGSWGDFGLEISGTAGDPASGGIGGEIAGFEFAIFEDANAGSGGAGLWWTGNSGNGNDGGDFALPNPYYQFIPSGQSFTFRAGRGRYPACAGKWVIYVRSRDGALNASMPATVAVFDSGGC